MDMKKKSKIYLSVISLSCVSIAALVAANIISNQNGLGNRLTAGESTYSLLFDESLGLAGNSTANKTTSTGGSVTVNASGLVAKTGDLGTMNAAGYIVNDTAVTGLRSIAIDFDETGIVNVLTVSLGVKVNGTVAYDQVDTSTISADGTITVSSKTALDVAYVKIANLGAAQSDITSITLNYVCTKSVTDYEKINYMVEGVSAKTEYVAKDSTFPATYTPTLDGYTFKEWVNASDTALTGTTVSAETTAKASWYRNTDHTSSGAIKKDLHLFTSAETITKDDGISDPTFADGNGTVSATPAKETYVSFTMPAYDYASAIASYSEVSFDLYSGWTKFKVAGGTIPYASEHNSSDPYHIYLRANSNGYGVYVVGKAGLRENTYLADISSEVANGTTGLSISFTTDSGAARSVTFTKLSYHCLDYKPVISSALATLTTSQTVANLVAYQTVVAQNLTTYEKTQYETPQVVTDAKTALSGDKSAVLEFPTPNFTDTAGMHTQLADLNVFTDTTKWAAANVEDKTDGTYFYGWAFQILSGNTSSFIELPRIAYSAYGTVTFKMWAGTANTDNKILANGNKVASTEDCPNQDWNYGVKIVTSGGSTVLTVYAGGGSKTIGTTVKGTWTLPSAVANGQLPLSISRTNTTAWTADETWGFSSLQGII